MRKIVLRCGLLLLVCLAAGSLSGGAGADRAFGPRFTVNTQGDITIAANSIESCLDALAACANVRNGVGDKLNNNDRTMTWIDVDGDPATFDSSSANLALPPGATVLFAGLYYGGRLTAGTGGSAPPNPGARNTVRFKAPGDTSYRSVTASQVDDSSTTYQGFVDVTTIVKAAGAGTYTTANVQLGTGLSDSSSGGWALVVAYGDSTAPSRNLSVFDGLQNVSSTGTVTIPLSGFQTPLSGPVTSTVGLVAYEGDLGTVGDGAQIQGASGFTALSNAVNPGPPATSASNSNVFNSTISNAGALVTSRTPSFQNNLGYDADLFRTTNLLGNGQTSTQVRLSTSGDAYQPGVVTIATDLFAPKITATKTVDRATANLGNTLTYTVAVQNTGQDAAAGMTFSDAIPAGAAFVPGSIRLNGLAVSDASGDDLGEFAAGRVVVRLGTGATAAVGGSLAPGASTTVSFQVTVATTGLALGATIDNTADLAFRAATTGVASTVTTAPATTRVLVPDLAVGKTHAPALAPGQPSTYTITVGNVGDGPTSGPVTVTDTLQAGLTLNGAVTGAGWACTTAGAIVTCTRSDVLAAGSDYPPISVPVLVSPGAQPGQLSNTASLQAPSDGNPDNNSSTDTGAVSEPAIDLHVEKVVTSTPNFTPVGYLFFLDPITYRIEVTNNGVADAANVQLAETLDAPLVLDSMTPSQGSCSGTVCNLGTITPGQAPVTIDVQVSMVNGFDTYPSAALLNNTATVSAPVGTEINPNDNSASAAISTVPWAETSITKTFAPAQPVAGGPVTYTLTVHSDGPGTVDMVAADVLPAALQKPPTAISISGGTGNCQFDPTGESIGVPPPGFPIVGCEIPQLGPGEDRVITIESTLAPDSAGTQVDNLALSSNTLPLAGAFSFEPDFTNNDDSVTFTPVAPAADLSLSKSGPSGPVSAGSTASFQLTVGNNGPQDATAVQVVDTLPAGLDFVDGTAGCTAAGQTVTCDVGPVAVGETRSLDITVRPGTSLIGQTVTNSATVQSAVADPDGSNNDAQASLAVGAPPPPGVQTEKTVADVTHPGGPNERDDTLRYTVAFTNTGQGGAAGFVADDLIPAGTSYVPGSLRILTGPGSPASPTDAVGDDLAEFNTSQHAVAFRLGQDASATAGGLLTAAGQAGSSTSVSFDVTINTDLPARFGIVNRAEASFVAQILGTPLTSVSPDVETIVDAPDVTLTKSHTGTFAAGTATQFALTVSNQGTIPTDGSPVTVTDAFPNGAAGFDSILVDSAPGWDCTIPAGTTNLTCTRTDPLAASTSYPTILVSALVHDPAPGALANTAAVDGGGDSDPSNNQATDIGPGTTAADLAVTKTVTEATVPSGGEVTFDLVVRNDGPSTATDVTVTDTLGANYENVSASASQGSCTTAVACALGALAPNTSATITITATVTANGTTLTNAATVDSPTPDPVPADNTDSATFTVQPTTDLELTKSVAASPAAPVPTAGLSDGTIYTINVRNAGQVTATNVNVVDLIPAGFTPTAVSAPGLTCSTPTDVMSCSRPALTVADGTLTITVTGTLSLATAGSLVVNSAGVTSDQADSDPDNNVAQAETTPLAFADLELQKSVSAPSVAPGEPVTFALALVNNGPNPAADVTVTDTLPAGLTLDSASPACSTLGGVVTCTVGSLAAGASRSFSVVARATAAAAGQTLVNVASVSASTPDPNHSDDQGTASIDVTSPPAPPPAAPPPPGQPDLVASKTASARAVSVGQDVTFTLGAANHGTADATGVAVTDPLPPGLAITTLPSGCTTATTTVTCAVGTLAADASRSFPVVVHPTEALAGKTITNIATAAGIEPDPTPANSTAQATITVQPLADLDLAADVSPDPLIAAEPATYTATIDNKGPSSATGIEVTEVLPAELTGVTAQPSQGTCTSSAAGTITCELGDLPSGAAAQITTDARVPSTDAGKTLTASIKVEAAEADSDTKNDSITLTTRVARSAPKVDLSVGIKVKERRVRTDGLLHYTITAANLSATPATAVRVRGTFNAPVRLVSALAGAPRLPQTPAAARCNHALPLVCSFSRLLAHERVTMHLVVRPLLARALVGTVTIRSNETETTLRNNRADVRVTVAAARASILVHKTVRERQVKAGSTVHYTIVVRAVTPGSALAVHVCDRLPRDQVFAAVDGAAYLNGQACWTIPRLGSGVARQFSVSAIVGRSSNTHRSTNTVRVVGANVSARRAAAAVRVTGVPGRPGGAGG